jgi:uncharacterized protein (DUF1501 family)
MKRRAFLSRLGLLAAYNALRPLRVWASSEPIESKPLHRLVVVFLRGAVDGLNVVVPYEEDAYFMARPNIAIPPPGKSGGALKLDERFGLHPALEGVFPFWKDKTLAFVHAAGSPHGTRSHFEAQAFMENGTVGNNNTPDGWMNRLLASLPGPYYPTRAVSFGGSAKPLILTGALPVATQPFGGAGQRPMPADRPQISSVFDRLYDGKDPLSLAYQEGRAARSQLMADLKADMIEADKGAPHPSVFAKETQNIARIIRGKSRVQLAFIALGGWDTHVNQGGSTGQLANRLRSLGDGLLRFVKVLGEEYARTTIVVMSEFGRTFKENGNGGTDHGHGNVMWIMGGGIKGGSVYGIWPGLAVENLYEKRDLGVTTDFRDVLGTVLKYRLQLEESLLVRVFPEFTFSNNAFRTLFS